MVGIMKSQLCAFKALSIPGKRSGVLEFIPQVNLCFSNVPVTHFKSLF